MTTANDGTSDAPTKEPVTAKGKAPAADGSSDEDEIMDTITNATQEGYMMRAVLLAAASVGFTLVAGLGADTILTSWNFRNMTVLSFFQNWMLFLVGFAAELCRPSHSSGHQQPLPVPAKYRLMLGACLAANVFFTNIASSLLTYPVQVVLKSSKLLVTMFMRRAFFHSRNSRVDIIGATLLTVGLAGFLVPQDYFDATSTAALAEGVEGMPPVGSRRFILGIVAICLALAGEAGMYIVEDNILFTRYHVSHTFIMKDGYLFAGLVTVAGIVGSGSAPKFLADMAVIDMRLLLLLCSFPLVLGIGVSFQLLLIKAHGSVVAAACQVFRKIASVAISMVVFHRVFGTPALVGSVFVSLSLIVKVVHKAIGIPFLDDPVEPTSPRKARLSDGQPAAVPTPKTGDKAAARQPVRSRKPRVAQ